MARPVTERPTEYRVTPFPVELRAVSGRRIGGYASVFGSESRDLGGFTEIVDHKSFNKSAGDRWRGVVCRFNHNDSMLLGTVRADTLRLDIDQIGLVYAVDLPESRSDVYELVSRGDVVNSSFAFQAVHDEWRQAGGRPIRVLTSVKLVDVAPVTNPAYPDATVGLRSLARFMDAPLEDVLRLRESEELRKLFVRTDAPAMDLEVLAKARELRRQWTPKAQPPPLTPGRDPQEALAELETKKAADTTAKLRLTEIMGKRYGPDAPPTPHQQVIDMLDRRWTRYDMDGDL